MRLGLGYLFIALSVILFLSIISFNPIDSSIFVSNVNPEPDNIAGIFGVWLGSPIVLLYGKFAGFLVAFGFLVVGINTLTQKKVGNILIKMTLFFIATISLSIIIASIVEQSTYQECGIIGISVVRSLSEIVPKFVIAILFGFIFLLSLFSSMKLFAKITKGIGGVFSKVVLAPFALFGLVKKEEPFRYEEALPASRRPLSRESLGEEDDIVNEAPQNDIFVPRQKPDFLQRPQPADKSPFIEDDETEGATFFNANTVKSDSPSWLFNNEGKSSIKAEIEKRFYREIYGDIPKESVVSSEKPDHNPITDDNDSLSETKIEEKKASDDFWSKNAFENEAPTEETADITLSSMTEPKAYTPDNTNNDTLEFDETQYYEDLYSEEDIPSNEVTYPVQDDGELFAEEEVEPEIVDTLDKPIARELPYIFPDRSILEKSFDNFSRSEELEEIERVSRVIENTFESFKITIKVNGYSRGPSITRYEIIPPSGLKLRNILTLIDDLALKLGSRNIRIVAPIGNKSIIGVEVPNKFRRNVVLRDIVESGEFIENKAKLPLILGKDITGNTIISDLAEMPHLLIAGTTGSGKSVFVNSLIGGILFTRTSDEVKFIFIDPKMVELELYNGIPHLLAPVITSPEDAIAVLEWTSSEMDRRYKILSEFGVRNIVDYNQSMEKINQVRRRDNLTLEEVFPYIVVVIDEFANLMLRLPRETEKIISKLAAMSRAVGIHLVVATQRPSVDVITGIIKANFPSRVSFRVASNTDSRTVLDKTGAEKLLGKGDMLFMHPNFTDLVRIQAPYVSNADVENIVRELKRNGTAEYVIDLENLEETANDNSPTMAVDYRQDPVFIDCLKAAVENRTVSASYLQRRFSIGYNRASRIIDTMDKMKILSPSKGASKPREVLINPEDLPNFID